MKFKNKLFSEDFIIPNFLSQKYIPSLDGFRAFSIVFVIIAHVNTKFNSQIIRQIFNGGLLGVHVFFVISGFLITSLLIKEKANNQTINLKNFYIRRFLRILPVAFLYVIFLVLLNYCFDLNIKWTSFFHQITFTENFNTGFVWQTKHYWSLSVEEQFYLLFPFLLKKNFKLYIVISILLLIASSILGVASHHYIVHRLTVPNAILYAGMFLNQGLYSIIIGSMTAVIICKFPLVIKLNPKFIGLIQLFILFSIWFFFSHPFIGGLNYLIESALIAILIVSAIYFVNCGFYNVLNLKIVKLIGVLSYSIYIWQQLFTYNQPWKDLFARGDSIPINLLVLVFVGYISYNYFEKPFLVLKTKFKS